MARPLRQPAASYGGARGDVKVDHFFGQFYYNNHSRDERQVVEWLYCPND